MEDKKFCQSCGMPMEKEEDFGTERDGSRNEDYCCYCYKDGSFTGDMTMEDMIRFNLKFNEENGNAVMNIIFRLSASVRLWRRDLLTSISGVCTRIPKKR